MVTFNERLGSKKKKKKEDSKAKLMQESVTSKDATVFKKPEIRGNVT